MVNVSFQQKLILGSVGPLGLVVLAEAWNHRLAASSEVAAAQVVLLAALCTGCYTDLRWRKIYNWVTYPAIAWALLLSGASSLGVEGMAIVSWAEAWAGTVACFGLLLFVYLNAGCGAGDVKLGAAIGAVLGWQAGIDVLLWSLLSIAGFLVVRALVSLGTYLAAARVWRVIMVGNTISVLQPAAAAVKQKLHHSPAPMAPFMFVGYLIHCFFGSLL